VSYRLEFRPQVEVDIVSAAGWYDSREPGLGAQFVRTLRDRVDELVSAPTPSRIRETARRIRWVFPKRFPYRIVYRVDEDVILVIAVIHAARHDREWRRRL
jgi:toxin ParE1/3/4